ncbi:MAG: transketolase [Burkholderiales bacterium]|nr:transketolase [Burkholderiales bacterium]
MTNYTQLANAIRILSADSVEKAKSGHPGMPMGMAEIGVALWLNHLQHNPTNPKWVNRDRFILSNGHGSMLLYSLLHLTGYNLTLTDLQQFRKLGSRTPGHPEYGYTDGVETTTGPLGQGLANAVGMALTETLLGHEFNREGLNIVDHYTYVFVGDGCLMEGISHEVCSFAGTIKLGKLIVIYDDNGISIDGEVQDWFSENVAQRFSAYNWQVIDNIDGHDINAVNIAINNAKNEANKPSIIICKTQIGKGSPNKVGKEECHGSPLGNAEIDLVRKQLNWQYPPFVIPDEIYQQFSCRDRGAKLEEEWNDLFTHYQQKYPELAQEFCRRNLHHLPANWNEIINKGIHEANNSAKSIASRLASQNAIEYYAKFLPELVGGSADLTGSNLTRWNTAQTLSAANNFVGNYISYGVREFGMSAMLNGMYLHGGIRPFGGTFLMFSEYARNALRMASLMKIAPIFVYTHDSIGLGEDGPTHQPVEQIATLRLIPNMQVWRPCDSVETMAAWGQALSQTTTPSCLIFSRQNLCHIQRTTEMINNISRGGYILASNGANPEITLFATGSEVELALLVYNKLVAQTQYLVQLVSMPATTLFDQQEREYQAQVLSNAKHKIVIEAGVADSWYKYVGRDGLIISMDTFGESAPASDLFAHFGFTLEKIYSKIEEYIAQ